MNSSCRDGRPREPALSEIEGSVPSPARQSLCRWLKFNAVGGVGIVVQLGTLAAFRSWLKLDYLLATGLAVEIAVVHNFLWHERYTWADRPTTAAMQSLVRLAKFNASNGAVSMVGNLGLMRLLVGEMKFHYVAANLIAVVVCSLVNFLLSDHFVFDAEANSALRGAWRSRLLLELAFGVCLLGVTARSNPGYNVCSCYALEWLHSASPYVLDRGTRLSPPVPFRSAFACARQSLRQRLVFLSSRCFANRL